MISWEDIYAQMQLRRAADSERFRRMIAVRDRANGDLVIPLPDVKGEPTIEPPSPRLILDAIDSTAMQAGSQTPSIFTASLDPTKTNGVKSAEYAAVRRNALYAEWWESSLDVLMLRYYRHLVGYGTGCMVVLPSYCPKNCPNYKTPEMCDNAEHCRARIELRDPLTTYPEMRSPDDVREPINVGFVFGRSKNWLMQNYGEKVRDWVTRSSEELWDVCEWVDDKEIVIGLLGPRFATTAYSSIAGQNRGAYANGIELSRYTNRAGMVPVAIPRRVTLDKIMGQVDTIIGSVDLLARMSALEVIAAEKAVFPDLQVIGTQGRPPQLLSEQNEWYDGRTGKANVLLDGEARYLVSSVGPATFQTMANVERSIRLSSGNPGLQQGEFTGSVRSGATATALAGFSINPRVQEAHMIAQRSLAVINKAILATLKGCWPSKKYFVFSGYSSEMVEYIPAKHFETFDNSVVYPFAGMDLSQVTVAVAQMNASGLMSRTTARQNHPLIADADAEEKRVLIERADEAYLAGFLQRLASGDPNAITDLDFVTFRKELATTGNLPAAVEKAQQVAQERQATLAPEPPDGMMAAPESMPGMSAPGQGAEMPTAAPGQGTPGLNEDQMRLAQVQRYLRAGKRPA